jgi:phosphoglucosamine mutase
VPFARAKVGDRYVMEQLLERGWQIGGENSGHIICLDKHSTGDGIVSALQVLHALRASGESLAQAGAALTLYPQVLVNVRVAKKLDFSANDRVKAKVVEAEAALAGRGRVLLRPSGTEPLLRVMVEGEDGTLVKHWAETIAQVVREVAAE